MCPHPFLYLKFYHHHAYSEERVALRNDDYQSEPGIDVAIPPVILPPVPLKLSEIFLLSVKLVAQRDTCREQNKMVGLTIDPINEQKER
jgi:hypothetical protein